MCIKIRPNIEVPEIPSVVEIGEEGSLREVLSIITPQLIPQVTGDLRDDPDIWGVRHDGVDMRSFKEGLDTKMHDSDVIGLELIMIAGG